MVLDCKEPDCDGKVYIDLNESVPGSAIIAIEWGKKEFDISRYLNLNEKELEEKNVEFCQVSDEGENVLTVKDFLSAKKVRRRIYETCDGVKERHTHEYVIYV